MTPFSDETMTQALTDYGCNCDNCCMAVELENGLAARKAKPLPKELATWKEIIAQCQWTGQDYSKSINVGTGQRRATLIAVAKYIEWLEVQLQAKG